MPPLFSGIYVRDSRLMNSKIFGNFPSYMKPFQKVSKLILDTILLLYGNTKQKGMLTKMTARQMRIGNGEKRDSSVLIQLGIQSE